MKKAITFLAIMGFASFASAKSTTNAAKTKGMEEACIYAQGSGGFQSPAGALTKGSSGTSEAVTRALGIGKSGNGQSLQ